MMTGLEGLCCAYTLKHVRLLGLARFRDGAGAVPDVRDPSPTVMHGAAMAMSSTWS